jgi:LCP family protein required for cell wall assembly
MALISSVIVLISAVSWGSFSLASASIKRVDVFEGRNERPDRLAGSAINYTRVGLTKAEIKELRVGSTAVAAGKRADTMILVHISKERDRATIISIPRDTFATVPEWTDSTGKVHPPSYSKINETFGKGDAKLLVQTLEGMTNLRIDHYVEVSFLGFKNMVDALGGVTICTKKDINDPKSYLKLKAGVHKLNGIDSLKYVRTRAFDGMGDLGRMQRQQQFVSAMIRTASSKSTLLNPVKVVKFVNAGLASVVTDPDLTQDDLIVLAEQLRGISTKKVRTLTVPLSNTFYNSRGVRGSVLWDKKLAPELWETLIKDEDVVKEVEITPSKKASSSKSSDGASAKPSTEIIDPFKSRTAEADTCGSLR